MNINNASEHPKVFYCRHMQPGTALYADEGMWLVDIHGMKNLIGSVGKKALPVYIGHQDVDLKNIKEQAVGYVTDSFYNKNDGWAWFKFVVIDDAGHAAVKRGWSVSDAYICTEKGNGGTKNNVPFKGEILNGEFTHLAIVPDPRYEGAKIYTPDEFKDYQDALEKQLLTMHNSKGIKPMFKFFNKVETDKPTDDSLVEIDGEMKSWGEVKNALETKEKEDGQTVIINGKKMTQAEAIAAYKELTNSKKMKKNGMKKKNAETEEEGEEGEEEKEEGAAKGSKNPKSKENKKGGMKKNADDMEEDDCHENAEDEDEAEEAEDKEAKPKKENKEKKNSVVDLDKPEKSDEFFNAMRTRHMQGQTQAPVRMVDTSIDQLERGRQRYGSAPKKTA